MSKAQFNKLIGDIKKADEDQVEAQFLIANLLTAIKDHKLYELGEYQTFNAMVAGELMFTVNTGNKFVSLYNHFTRLKYNKTEFLKLMQHHGWRRVEKAINGAKRKMGTRAITAFHKARSEGECQFNMHVHTPELTARIDSALSRFGMEATENGRRMNMTSAFIALLDDYEKMVKTTNHTTGAKLKAVA